MDDLGELFGRSAAMETVRESLRRLVARQQSGRRLQHRWGSKTFFREMNMALWLSKAEADLQRLP